MKKLVITPTYNERENIKNLINRILAQNINELEILVVDDNSPDDTGEEVLKISAQNPRIHLLKREIKNGLGSAYLAGFNWAAANGFGLIIQMDADLSHNPADLPKLIAAANDFDFIIGSRYVAGGGISNWQKFRILLSSFANWYARKILGLAIKDITGGFNAWHAPVLEKIDLKNINSSGYCFSPELKYRAAKNGFSFTEIPIIFQERLSGKSKMSWLIILEAVWRIILLRFKS